MTYLYAIHHVDKVKVPGQKEPLTLKEMAAKGVYRNTVRDVLFPFPYNKIDRYGMDAIASSQG